MFMLVFYLDNVFVFQKNYIFFKKWLHIQTSDFFYFPRRLYSSPKINFLFSLKIYRSIKNRIVGHSRNKTLYGYLRKKNFIKLCRFNFMKFFFFGFMPYRFNTFIKRTKSYNYILLNVFFFNSIGHIINLFPANNYIFLYNSFHSIYFTVNGIKIFNLWHKLKLGDAISFYWTNVFTSQTLYFSNRNKLYIKWVTFNKYNWTPCLFSYKVLIDFRQNLGVFYSYTPSFSKKNAFNFNTFSLYNWKFIT